MTTIEEKVKKAHRACPCLRYRGTESCWKPGYCVCVQAVRPLSNNKVWKSCTWIGHAAIDELAASVGGHAQNCRCHEHSWRDNDSTMVEKEMCDFATNHDGDSKHPYRDPRCSKTLLPSDNVRPNADASPSSAGASGHPAGGGTNPAAPLPESARGKVREAIILIRQSYLQSQLTVDAITLLESALAESEEGK